MLRQAQKRQEAASHAHLSSSHSGRLSQTAQLDKTSTHNNQSNQSTQRGPPGQSAGTDPRLTSNQPSSAPPINSDDLTLILQYPPTSTSTSSTIQSALTSRYGPITHFIVKEPPLSTAGTSETEGLEGKKKKAKGKKVVVEFEKGNWGGCWACWNDHDTSSLGWGGGKGRGLEDGVKAKWAKGQEPEWVNWATNQQRHQSRQSPSTHLTNGNNHDPHDPHDIHDPSNSHSSNTPLESAPSFDSAPDFGPSTSVSTTMADLLTSHETAKHDERMRKRQQEEFESMTLLKMRQAERQRLEEEIRKREEGEDVVV